MLKLVSIVSLQISVLVHDRAGVPMGSRAFFRSLLLTSTLSFVAPVLLIGIAIASLSLINYIPITEVISRCATERFVQFLTTFGDGSAIEGTVVIGLTCSLVGVLFDTYAFYYQCLRNS